MLSCKKFIKPSQFIGIKPISAVAQLSSTLPELVADDHSYQVDTVNVIGILSCLRQKPKQAFSFFQQLKQRGFRHDVETYATIILILCYWGFESKLESVLVQLINESKEGRPGFEILDLFQALMDRLDRGGDKLSNSLIVAVDTLVKVYVKFDMFNEAIAVLFQPIWPPNIFPHIFSCNFLMNRLIKHDGVDIAMAIYQELTKLGFTMSDHTYAILMKAHCKKSNIDEALHVFDEMAEPKVIPNQGLCLHKESVLGCQMEKKVPINIKFAYNALISGLCKEHKLEEAKCVLLYMERKRVVPNAYTYGALIRGYCNTMNIKEALDCHDEMISKGIEVNSVIVSSILRCLCQMGRFDLAVVQFNQLKDSGMVFLDGDCYNIVIDALCKLRKVEEAEHVVLYMERQGVLPDVYTYGALIQGHCNNKNLKNALGLYNAMVSKGIKTNCVIISSILQCFCQMGRFDLVVVEFNHVKDKQIISLDGICYNIVVDALCKLGKVEEAVELLEQIDGTSKQMVINLDVKHYTTLINGYCLKGKLDEARNIFKKMKEKGLQPDIVTYNALIGGLSQKGFTRKTVDNILGVIKAQGLEPNTCTHNMIIEGLCIGGNVKEKEAEAYLDSLEDKHLDNYSAMVKGYCEANRIKHAFELFVWWSKQQILVNKASCCKLLCKLCMEGSNDCGLELLKTMLLLGVEPSKFMYHKLIDAYRQVGNKKKARLVCDLSAGKLIQNSISCTTK